MKFKKDDIVKFYHPDNSGAWNKIEILEVGDHAYIIKTLSKPPGFDSYTVGEISEFDGGSLDGLKTEVINDR